MRIPSLLFFTGAAFLAVAHPSQADSFTIDEWALSTGIEDFASGFDWDHSTVVQNPFVASHSAVVGDSTATSDFDFAWAEQFGQFLIESTQQAAGVETSMLFTVSSGGFYITLAEDLSLHIDGAFSYDLTADWMTARFGFSIFDPDDETFLFIQEERASTFPGEPSSGTLTIEGDAILPAGRTFLIGYNMSLDTFSGTAGHFATGAGHVNFTITPEPSTLALLMPLAVGFVRRRAR